MGGPACVACRQRGQTKHQSQRRFPIFNVGQNWNAPYFDPESLGLPIGVVQPVLWMLDPQWKWQSPGENTRSIALERKLELLYFLASSAFGLAALCRSVLFDPKEEFGLWRWLVAAGLAVGIIFDWSLISSGVFGRVYPSADHLI